jgi:hypothetical protein
MKDMEHFTKLIQKTTQQLLVEWSSVGYPSLTGGIAPDADIKTWREAVLTTVLNLDNTVRAKLEGIAERVNNLSDRAGQEAINSLRDNISNGGFKFEVQQLMVAWCSTPPLRIILHAVISPQALCVAGG